jgi:hypothetical protein
MISKNSSFISTLVASVVGGGIAYAIAYGAHLILKQFQLSM